MSEPPRLLYPVRHAGGEFEFQLSAERGKPVDLEISRDFKNWERLKRITPEADLVAVSDRKAGQASALFYRARADDLKSNYLGFVSLELAPGYSMVANPLQPDSHEIARLFPNPPEGSILSKYSLASQSISSNKFQDGQWSVPGEPLMPGEGAVFFNPQDVPAQLTFVGDAAREPQTVPLQKGASLRGALLPVAGRLDADLGFPLSAGDAVSLYHRERKEYIEHRWDGARWNEESGPPILQLGEAFWISKTESAVWLQRLPEIRLAHP